MSPLDRLKCEHAAPQFQADNLHKFTDASLAHGRMQDRMQEDTNNGGPHHFQGGK